MIKWVYIAVWALVAIAGAIITRTNPLWWFAGVVGKLALRLIFTVALAVVLYVLFYFLIVAGYFGY